MKDGINDNDFDDYIRNSLNQNGIIFNSNHKPIDYNDYDKKEIGDRVISINTLSISHIGGSKFEFNDYVEFDDYSYLNPNAYYVVVATGENSKFKTLNDTYIQDLVIAQPISKKQYRISSLHVKLFN